ncbi:protein of unknown function [Burkholderia sp. YR290]|nr:protein of unknown function [Burkholderia sp. YR290]
MLPPEPVVRAALRWIALLRSSSLSSASSLIFAGSATADISRTQYFSALDWLKSVGLLVRSQDSYVLASELSALSSDYTPYALFHKALESTHPAWLNDADVLIPDESELPDDARGLAAALGLGNQAAYSAIQSIHGKVDLASRAMIGALGEKALVHMLETRWPGSTLHVAEYSDAFGYDVRFMYQNIEWHLEVKSTVRRGRLRIFVSRNEYEVGSRDPHWRLVVLGLDDNNQIAAVATLPPNCLNGLAPRDTLAAGKWQAASFELTASDLISDLDFLGEAGQFWRGTSSVPGDEGDRLKAASFAWMPSA